MNGKILQDGVALLGLVAHYQRIVMLLLRHYPFTKQVSVETLFGKHVASEYHSDGQRSEGQALAKRRVNEDRPNGVLRPFLDALHYSRIEAWRWFHLFFRSQSADQPGLELHGLQF